MKVVAFQRSAQGTSASRRLRHSGRVPGIVYGGGHDPSLIELDHNALFFALQKEKFHSSILDMEVEGAAFQALLRDFQMHPYKQQVMHVDFQRIDPNAKLSMKVPLHFVGAENSPAVKLDKAIINHVVNEVEVSCLPKDLPEFIEVDLSQAKKGASITAADLKLPAGVGIVTHGKGNFAIATVVVQEVEEVVAPEAAAAPAAAAKGGKPAAKTAPAKTAAAKSAPAKSAPAKSAAKK
jgi:large subunit ribosomal protein L25